METRRVLLTGFDAFGGLSENISWQVAELLGETSSIVDLGPRESGSGQPLHRTICIEWVAQRLSVDEAGSRAVADMISNGSLDDFSAIIHLGLARDAKVPRIESQGINRNRFMEADNSGRTSNGEIVVNGPDLISCSVDSEYVRQDGLSTILELSHDAGGYVCNETLYRTLHALDKDADEVIPCTFLHLPPSEEMDIKVQLNLVQRVSAIVVQPPHIEVAGALFRNGTQWMVSRRASGRHEGLWEFPGGKLELGETVSDALIRECDEELGWTIQPIQFFERIFHVYPHASVELEFWICEYDGGAPPALRSHTEHRWVAKEDLGELDWLEADVPLVKRIQSLD
tara:strand:- start:1679 stop:2704 length:1026 start_codon:yes stop_codon:yes gene_type:complete